MLLEGEADVKTNEGFGDTGGATSLSIVLAHLGSLGERGSPPVGQDLESQLVPSILLTLASANKQERREVAVALPEPHVGSGDNRTLNFGRAFQPFGSDNPRLGQQERAAEGCSGGLLVTNGATCRPSARTQGIGG